MNRPHFHFTPQKGWINDPNGLVYIEGEYHLFYQYYPNDTVWGPMHWGHAVSRDLLHWEDKEIALYPDELGYIFSGSCIYDKDNISGLGSKEKPPLLAYFTHHDPQNGRQQQSIAYSLDREHFIKYEGNPVIPNIEKKDFRDPKVFENPIKGGYTMALAAGPVIEFYHSANLLDWELTGTFQPGTCRAEDEKTGTSGNGYSGICECPDCFPLETEEGTKWVLIISMCLMEEDVKKAMEAGVCASAHVMQYYIGEFDGSTFIDTTCAGEPLLFEFGTDNYAAVTFAGCSDKIMLGWGENWNYVRETPIVECQNEDANEALKDGCPCEKVKPADSYRGKMTLARKLALMNTRFGYRLQSMPVGIEKIELCKLISAQLPEQAFQLQLDYKQKCDVTFSNDVGEKFVVSIRQDTILVDRRKCGVYAVTASEELKAKHYDVLYAPRFTPECGTLKIISDEGYFEIFADDGLAVFSIMTYPVKPFVYVNIESSVES